jgi:DNA-binding NarL/FixJ family response regulator
MNFSKRDELTKREKEVYALIQQRLKGREIAEKLSISERTVETHVSKILRKLGFESKAHLLNEIKINNNDGRLA